MENDLLLYQKCKPDSSIIEQVFSYDVRTLEQADDLFISKGVIALSQYLVYFKSQYNMTKSAVTNKERVMEGVLFSLITADIIKQHKTKKDARIHLVYSNQVLNKLQEEIDILEDELVLLDGIDKTIMELIAAFKRELTRRENELYQRKHFK
jgi:hypothetical protein